MKRKIFILVSCCTLFSISLMLSLYAFSDYVTHKPNSFYRLFPPHPVGESGSLPLVPDAYYFSGATYRTLYLGNRHSPHHLLALDVIAFDTLPVRIEIPGAERLPYYSVMVSIDSPYFYFYDGAIPYIYRGRLGEWIGERYPFDSAYFQDLVPVSRRSFVIRTYSKRKSQNVIGRLSLDTPHVKLNYSLLEKQVDGLFCTDGMLHYDSRINRLVYLYHYRNQYVVADTNLVLSFRGTTIDTFSRAQVRTAILSDESGVSNRLGGPPLSVNKHSCLSGEWLFVHSELLAKNENKKVFDRSSVIDVYNLLTRTYRFSFYLPDKEGKKITELTVVGDRLFVLYDHLVEAYTLDPKYFQRDASASFDDAGLKTFYR